MSPRSLFFAALLRVAGITIATSALGACGDDDDVAADAAVDAEVPVDLGMRDLGVDLGPATPTDLCDPTAAPLGAYPAPGAYPPNAGPGVPAVSFTTDQLFVNCAYLDGGEIDVSDHHNLVTMYDGYLLMPAAPEFGRGGLTLWDLSEPCSPVRVGYGASDTMRETHAIGFSSLGGKWAVVDQLGAAVRVGRSGIQFWDLSDSTAPVAVADLELPGSNYPDAYARITLSVFWQPPYVYVGGADNGIYIVDAADPRNPFLLTRYAVEPTMRVGQVQVIGDLLVATTAEGARTVLLDVSDPTDPQPIPGGDFQATDATGTPREAYFSNMTNGHVFYARKEGGGGFMVHDIRDPMIPVHAGSYRSEGNGGYVSIHENFAFVGESSFAQIYDITDLRDIQVLARLDLEGDLDTLTPLGHLAVLSVDDEAMPNQGSAIAPWQTTPDINAPRVTWSWPVAGATDVPRGARLGLSVNESVDVASAWQGSVRVYEMGTDPATTRVDGIVSAQETTVNFTPLCPLEANTMYVFEAPAGGLHDFSGNAISEPFSITFTTSG